MRFTPSPVHTDALMEELIDALQQLWSACPVADGRYVRLAAE
jgi:5-aminolevulinate synthase